MVRYPRDPRPGVGPVHHARRTRHADGTRRSRHRGEPATGPGPHHPQPRKVRTTRAPEGELAATRNAHRTTRKETIVNPEPAVGGGARAASRQSPRRWRGARPAQDNHYRHIKPRKTRT